MSKDELNALVDHGVEYANKILIEDRHKELSPIFHLISRSGKEDAVVSTPWGNNFEKKLAVAQVKSMARKMDARMVLFMTEAWVTKHRTEKPLTSWHARQEAAKEYPPPSESPERIEIVMILATNPDNEYASRMLQIVRHKPGGRIVSLVPDADAPKTYESWIFDGMFRPSHE